MINQCRLLCSTARILSFRVRQMLIYVMVFNKCTYIGSTECVNQLKANLELEIFYNLAINLRISLAMLRLGVLFSHVRDILCFWMVSAILQLLRR